MTDKLTDGEIVKALEGMIQFANTVNRSVLDMVDVQTLKNTLDLINRLQGENKAFAEIIKKQDDEISGLRKDLLSRKNLEESFSKSVKQLDKKLARTVELTKAEAYKEFAERLKEQAEVYTDSAEDVFILAVGISKIDNLLKELVGENDAR